MLLQHNTMPEVGSMISKIDLRHFLFLNKINKKKHGP